MMLDSSGPAGQTSTSTAPVGGGALGAVASPGSLNLARLPVDAASHAIFTQALVYPVGSTISTAARRLAVRVLAETWDALPDAAYPTAYTLMFRLIATDESEANMRFGDVLLAMFNRQRIDRQYASDQAQHHASFKTKRAAAVRRFEATLDAAVR